MLSEEGLLTELQEASVLLHETFRAHVDAGFTEEQALRLIAYAVSEIVKNMPDNE